MNKQEKINLREKAIEIFWLYYNGSNSFGDITYVDIDSEGDFNVVCIKDGWSDERDERHHFYIDGDDIFLTVEEVVAKMRAADQRREDEQKAAEAEERRIAKEKAAAAAAAKRKKINDEIRDKAEYERLKNKYETTPTLENQK